MGILGQPVCPRQQTARLHWLRAHRDHWSSNYAALLHQEPAGQPGSRMISRSIQ
jgi:hypothetical protein